jgi:unspecific monooxygenase
MTPQVTSRDSSSLLTDPRFWIAVSSVGVSYIIWSTGIKGRNKQDGLPMPPTGLSFDEFLAAIVNKSGTNKQQEWLDRFGDVFTIPSPLPLIIPNQVFIADPRLVKELCQKQANMYRDPTRFTTRASNFAAATRSTVGMGVTNLLGEEWRWRKDAMLKEFHKKRMMEQDRGLVEKIVREGQSLCCALEQAADASGKPVEVDVLTTRAAVGVILYFLFGRDLDFDARDLRDAAKDVMDCLGFAIGTPGYPLLKRIPGTASYKQEQLKFRAWKVIDDIVGPEIIMLLEECEGRRPVHPERKTGSVIASLIANEPRFRKGGVDAMIAEGRVFVLAGFETTAHSLSFALGMMAERPDLASQLAAEAVLALGDKDLVNDPVAIRAALEQADVVKHFFMESVRLYPLAPALGGVCTDDIPIETSDGKQYLLKKGTSTFFPNVVLQRNKQYCSGKDPNEIDPDRWNCPQSAQPFLHTFNTGAVSMKQLHAKVPEEPKRQVQAHQTHFVSLVVK